MSEALAVQTTTPKGILTRDTLKAEGEQRALLAQFIREQMVDGIDYGKIPGTDKPALLKPGAEKLVDIFRCTPKYTLVKAEEDFKTGFFHYMFRVRIYQRNAKAVLAEGYGSANSMEGRYRWREAQRKCPNCSKATIIKGKAEYGGGWLCFAKKGGCGAKFKDGDAKIEGQSVGRVENDDIASQANTILKMAKKRALVDGALAIGRCSDMFTQDVDDDAPPEERPRDNPPGSAAPVAQSRTEETIAAVRGALAAPAAKQPTLASPASPVAKPPRMAIVDVAPGETEEDAKARTQSRAIPVADRIFAMVRADGLEGFTAARFLEHATGKKDRADLVEADIASVRAALDVRRARDAGNGDAPEAS